MEHISYSRIRQFSQCNRQHFYARVAKLPEPPAFNLIYGIAAHAAIEQCNLARIAGKPEPDRGELANIVHDSIFGENGLNGREPNFDPGAMVSDVVELVDGWKDWDDRSPTPIAAEFEARRVVPGHENLEFLAYIDAVLDDRPESLKIEDFKTSKYGWDELEAGLETQPQYYGFVFGHPLTMVYTILIKAQKRDKIQYQHFTVNVTQRDIDMANEEMRDYLAHRDSKIRNRKNFCGTCSFNIPCLNNEIPSDIRLFTTDTAGLAP